MTGVNAFWNHLRLLKCVQNTAHCKADRHGAKIILYSTSLKPEQKMPRLRWRIRCVTHLSTALPLSAEDYYSTTYKQELVRSIFYFAPLPLASPLGVEEVASVRDVGRTD
jgi:hypothetical protein